MCLEKRKKGREKKQKAHPVKGYENPLYPDRG
jgi:hypothetical protein